MCTFVGADVLKQKKWLIISGFLRLIQDRILETDYIYTFEQGDIQTRNTKFQPVAGEIAY